MTCSPCPACARQAFLGERFGLAAHVLYDRPPAFFQPADLEEAHALLLRLQPGIAAAAIGDESMLRRHGLLHQNPHGSDSAAVGAAREQQGMCSCSLVAEPVSSSAANNGGAEAATGASSALRPRPGRPALLLSSTSWTPDEDFGLLLEAAVLYDEAVAAEAAAAAAATAGADSSGAAAEQGGASRGGGGGGGGRTLPDVLLFITGRGPQREEYLAKARALRLRHVAICRWVLLGMVGCTLSSHCASARARVRLAGTRPVRKLICRLWYATMWRGRGQRGSTLAATTLPPCAPCDAACGWKLRTTRSCWQQPTWGSACTHPPRDWTCP